VWNTYRNVLDAWRCIDFSESNARIVQLSQFLLSLLANALLPGQALVGRSPATLQRARPVLLCATETAAAASVDVPKIESACSFDYVPLLTALQAAEFRDADQLTRDALIKLAGEKAIDRGFVYFTEAPKIPMEDMATIERLWNAYSGGKFGYSVQQAAWSSKKVNKNFDTFFDRIGWRKDGALLRWLPEAKSDEFIYDLEKAPKGHLPLTSTLRGQQLLQGLLTHPVWETDEFKDVSF